MDGFRIDRSARAGRHRLTEVFHGLETSVTLTTLFPKAPERRRFVRTSRLQVSPRDLYCYVDDEDGTVVLGQGHLRDSEERVLYLDDLQRCRRILLTNSVRGIVPAVLSISPVGRPGP